MTQQDEGSTAPDRLLVVGEALIDVVRERSGATREHVGGSPANVALGLGRLGRAVSLLTHLGRDAYGEQVERHLRASGVDLVAGSFAADRTSTAVARLAPDGSAEYEFDIDWSIPATDLTPAPIAVHTGSIGAFLAPGATAVRAIMERARAVATVSFDPNVRPPLFGSPAAARLEVEDRVALCDVVKASEEDVAWLYPGADATDVARRWLAAGPAVVVVTLGGGGSVAVARAGVVQVATVPVEVVDTVGAGDAFMGGLLDALWTEQLLGAQNRLALQAIGASALTRCLQRAALIAAITVSRAGAQPPTSHDLAEWPADRLPPSWR